MFLCEMPGGPAVVLLPALQRSWSWSAARCPSSQSTRPAFTRFSADSAAAQDSVAPCPVLVHLRATDSGPGSNLRCEGGTHLLQML